MASSTSPAASAAPYFEFRTADRVPETHVWSGLHNYPTVEATGRNSVPVVDMACGDADVVARAAEEWGGFLLVGHGVPGGVVDRAQEQIAHLFSRPAPVKTHAARRTGEGSGYGMPPYALHFNQLMWSEGYTFPAANVRSEFRRVWPDAGDEYLRFWCVACVTPSFTARPHSSSCPYVSISCLVTRAY
jgi:gibberellin 3beta-dioxygenase